MDLASFARNAPVLTTAGLAWTFAFLRHPEIGVYLELFTYRHPKVNKPSTAGRPTI